MVQIDAGYTRQDAHLNAYLKVAISHTKDGLPVWTFAKLNFYAIVFTTTFIF